MERPSPLPCLPIPSLPLPVRSRVPPLTSQGIWWSAVSSPSVARGGTPAENGFGALYSCEKAAGSNQFEYSEVHGLQYRTIGPSPKWGGGRSQLAPPPLNPPLDMYPSAAVFTIVFTSMQHRIQPGATDAAACIRRIQETGPARPRTR